MRWLLHIIFGCRSFWALDFYRWVDDSHFDSHERCTYCNKTRARRIRQTGPVPGMQ